MPSSSESTSGNSPRAKPLTRGASIRNTLTKAIAEAISKDSSKDSPSSAHAHEKPAKKAKEPTSTKPSHSRRLSIKPTAPSTTTAPRTSIGGGPGSGSERSAGGLSAVTDQRPSSAASISAASVIGRSGTPEAKSKSSGSGSGVSARRRGGTTTTTSQHYRSSTDEPQPKSSIDSATGVPPPSITVNGSVPVSGSGRSLRPRQNGLAVTSALPKYRPKSATSSEGTKMPSNLPQPPASPTTRIGTRRKSSSPDQEEKEEKKTTKSKASSSAKPSSATPKSSSPTGCDKSRSASPVPQRTALKVVNSAPQTPTGSTRIKPPTGSPHSPTRPKTIKTNAPANQSGAIRSGSSSSSSSSHPPQTPKTPNARSAATSKSNTGAQASPSRLSPYTTRNESPLARHSRKPLSSKTFTPSTPSSSSHGNMSHISEANSEDSDEADVEMLLAPMANMCAPTPAMPRVLQKSRKRLAPETPTRTSATVGPSMSNLPGRANLSYLSPLPPDKDGSSSLRPNHPSNAPAMRGSILSWEQLANEASKTLGADEIENMLYDIPAPFRSGAVSPSPSMMHLEIPESPCLSALSSPGGYGSISQVLLPDVTPSPAMHHIMHRQYDSASAEAPAVDHAIVTLLRLQLASAENTGKERLQQMQKLEEEVHLIKGARARETQELMKQVEVMESQLRGSLEMRERADEEKRVYMTSLEEQVRLGQTRQDRAVEDAKRSLKEEMRQEWRSEMRKREKKIELRSCAKEVKGTWEKVKYQSESQLDFVRADLAVLKVFLQELDVLQSQVAVM